MANAVYTLSFESLIGSTSYGVGDDYTIEIWSKALNVNPSIAIKGSERPLTITWRNVNDIFEPVITSEATIEVISETDLFWKAFFTANRGDWILKVYRNSVLIWQGQNITESYSEPYLVTPYKSSIRFSDLGDMDFIYFQPSASAFYSGFKSLSEIIFLCTNKLQFQLDINEYTNCINLEGWNNASVTEKSLLCNTFLDTSVFRTYEDNVERAMTCMEVLNSVLYSIGCRIVQASENGLDGVSKWHVQKIDEMINSQAITTFGIDHTTYAVTVSQYTDDLARSITNGKVFYSPTLDISPTDQNQDLNISERFNKVTYRYTTQELYRKNAEILLNGIFDKGVYTNNNTIRFPKYFQCSTDISSSNACQIINGLNPPDKDLSFRYKTLPLQGGAAMAGMVAAQGTTLSTVVSSGSKYIRTTGTESGDTVDAQTAAASKINFSPQDNLKLKVKGKIEKLVDYSYAQSHNQNNSNYLTSEVFHFSFKVTLTYDNGNIYNWFMNPTYPSYGQNKWTIWNGTPYTVGDNTIHRIIGTKSYANVTSGVSYHLDDFEILFDSALFPESGAGKLSFRMYIPRTQTSYGQPIGLASCTVQEMSLKYVTDGDFSDEILINKTFFTLTDAKENTYTFDVKYGDGPADYCLSSFRYGVVSATDKYKQTSSWRKLSSSTALSAANIFNVYPAQKLISAYQRVISGDYIGIFDIMNTLSIYDGVDTKKYLIMGDNWDVKGSIHSITMQEITEQSISITIGDEERLFGSSTTPSDSASIVSPVSTTFSGKGISNAIILNQPVSLKVQSVQTKYPG